MGSNVRSTRRGRGASAKRSPVRPRSIACTDEDWEAVEEFAARRGLASASEAARLLMRAGLHTERLVEEIAAAEEWQLAQAWADAQAIGDGDRAVGSWDRIAKAGERARARIRARTGSRSVATTRA